jgi:hypothetical protein
MLFRALIVSTLTRSVLHASGSRTPTTGNDAHLDSLHDGATLVASGLHGNNLPASSKAEPVA